MKTKIYLLTFFVLLCLSCKDKKANTEQNTNIQKIAENALHNQLEELNADAGIAIIMETEAEVVSENDFDEVSQTVSNFINSIKEGKEAVSNLVNYPLERIYPLLPIKNKQDFLERYEDLFDSKLQQEIIYSNPLTDWESMGWHGTMFQNGTLWIDSDGKLTSLNYQSDKESQLREKIIETERKSLHESIQTYEQPILIMETSTDKIRIDDLGNGNYRYASWKLDSKKNDKPNLILTNGSFSPDGSGGNHAYIFTNGNFKYECWIWEITGGGSNSPASLVVYENENEILRQDAHNLKN